jgi:hypothetical protein
MNPQLYTFRGDAARDFGMLTEGCSGGTMLAFAEGTQLEVVAYALLKACESDTAILRDVKMVENKIYIEYYFGWMHDDDEDRVLELEKVPIKLIT